jgi:hypothetical protein
MTNSQSKVTEKPAVRVGRDTTKARIGAMTPSFPPAKAPKDCDKTR